MSMATLTQSPTPEIVKNLTSQSQILLHVSPHPSAAPNTQDVFAFVRIHNDVCLAQTNSPIAASKTPFPPFLITPIEFTVFRHEFGTIFRLARHVMLPAHDVQILTRIDDANLLHDVDSGVVFLSREMTNQLLRYTTPRRVQPSLRSRRIY